MLWFRFRKVRRVNVLWFTANMITFISHIVILFGKCYSVIGFVVWLRFFFHFLFRKCLFCKYHSRRVQWKRSINHLHSIRVLVFPSVKRSACTTNSIQHRVEWKRIVVVVKLQQRSAERFANLDGVCSTAKSERFSEKHVVNENFNLRVFPPVIVKLSGCLNMKFSMFCKKEAIV